MRLIRQFERRDFFVVAVILLMFAMLAAPYLLGMREAARRAFCEKRQTDAAMAVRDYEQDFGEFPGYRDWLGRDWLGRNQRDSPPHDGQPADDRFASTWAAKTLPYLGRDVDRDALAPRALLAHALKKQGVVATSEPLPYLPEMMCPNDPRTQAKTFEPWLTWVVNTGAPDLPSLSNSPPDWPANGVFLDYIADPNTRQSLENIEAADGASYTLLLTENVDAGSWPQGNEAELGVVWFPKGWFPKGGRPKDKANRRPLTINQLAGKGDGSIRFARPASFHAGGVNAMFCDGASRFLSETIDSQVWRDLLTSDNAAARPPGGNRTPPNLKAIE